MGFWYARSNSNGTRNAATETLILPSPTYPVYSERFPYTIQKSAGRGIRQRVKLNPEEFRWVWENYRPTVPRYESLYWDLFNLQSHILEANGDSPYVWLKEDVTLNFGKYNSTTDRIEPDWVRVVVTYVGRTEPDSGGKIYYPTTELRFTIDDPSITEII